MTAMVSTLLNGKWRLIIPEHRAARPEWTNPPYWEPERLSSMNANILPGDVVYDVGAEEGEFSGLCATWAGQEGGVVLIEPNPRVWPNIRAIWEANQLSGPLGWWVGFLSDENMETPPRADVDQAEHDGWPTSAYGPLIGDHGFRHLAQQADATPQITLDSLVERTGAVPNVITMDVEGAEFRVLRGAEKTLREHKPLVYVSVHPAFLRDLYATSAEDLYSWMSGLGYRDHHLATDHEVHMVFWHPQGRAPVELPEWD